jgi:predicted patatin/cPLA2 family phospholipase
MENTLQDISENNLEDLSKNNFIDIISKNIVNTSKEIIKTISNLIDTSNNHSENIIDLSLNKATDISLNNVTDISLNNITDISLNKATDISLNNVTDISLNKVTDIYLNTIKDRITCLCFSGGGVKGISFIGALEELEKNDLIDLNKIDTYCGTSVGSMYSFLLNIGLTIQEIKDFIIAFNFSKLTGDVDCVNFLENFGINNGDRIKFIFIKFIEIKYNKKDITFEELYEITKKKLIIIGTNLTEGKEEVFSVDLTPSFSVINAIRISISVPIIFTPFKINNILYVDGGIVNNFPINHCPEYKTLGLYIKNSKKKEINSIQELITSCFSLTNDCISERNIIEINKITIRECWNKYKKIVIKIENPKFEYTKFDLSNENKNSLIELGTKTIKEFIINFNE